MSLLAKNVGKSIGNPATQILKNINFRIEDGEFVALTGKSGSGKSTLLYLLSSLDVPSEGEVEIEGRRLGLFTPEGLNRLRNEKIGFVFQFHYLIAELSALENVLMPAMRLGREEERRKFAMNLLSEFGLDQKMGRLPRQLSGGEQQRVAIARALVMEPKYIFADEPTGSLDSANGELVMKIITTANEKRGATIVMVTHDPDFGDQAKRKIHLVDGRVVNETS